MELRLSAFVTGFTTVMFILSAPQHLLQPYMFRLSSALGFPRSGVTSLVAATPPRQEPAETATSAFAATPPRHELAEIAKSAVATTHPRLESAEIATGSLQMLHIETSTKLSHPTSQWFCGGLGPQPFAANPDDRIITQVYAKGDAQRKESVRKTQKILDKLQHVDQHNCTSIQRLVEDGLSWNEIGLDFSAVQQKRGLLDFRKNAEETIDDDMRMVMHLYCNKPALMSADHFLRHRGRNLASLRFANAQHAQTFLETGYLRFDTFGLDMDRLQDEADLAWNGQHTHTKAPKLDSIEALLQNNAILELASFYMGTDIKLNGYKIFRIGPKTTSGQYFSGLWHHDSCGRRLKLFIYLQDVSEDGAPTEIAAGSHSTSFFHIGEQGTNRFSNSLVQSQYKVEKMLGRRGGGFIFDTNSVHRGYVDGGVRDSPRDVVIIDFTGKFPGHMSCEEQSAFPIRKTYPFSAGAETAGQPVDKPASPPRLGFLSAQSDSKQRAVVEVADTTHTSAASQAHVMASSLGTNVAEKSPDVVAEQIAPATSSLQVVSSSALSMPTAAWFCSGHGPQPFKANAAERLEVFDKRDGSRKGSTARTQKVLDRLKDVTPATCVAIRRLVNDGMTWNEFGIDFSSVGHNRTLPATNKSVLAKSHPLDLLDEDIRQAMDLYCVAPRIIAAAYFLQNRVRDLGVLQHANHENAKALYENGFLQFNTFGLDMDLLQAEANAAWDGTRTQTRAVKLSSIEALLQNKAVLELASFYMGSAVTLKGYKLFRIGRDLTSSKYFSGLFHHDSCSRRLKLFIYLQDVGENGAPTEIATGSHSTSYYFPGSSGCNRFSPALVQKQYQIRAMTGPRGGGFMFDTNSIHRGFVDGAKRNSERDVVIVDFAGQFPDHTSCTEAATFPVGSSFEFPQGKAS